jgi:hypothetical protein
MGMNMNHMVTQSLQRQLDQVVIQQNQEEDVAKMKSQLQYETI